MQRGSGEGKGSPTVFKCHGSLENTPSCSALLPFPSNHGRAPNIGRQSPLGITKFLSNSLYSSQGVLRCPGQSKRRANILPLSFRGTISLSRSPVGITILDANTIIQMWEATLGNSRGVLTIHAHLAMLSTKIYIHIYKSIHVYCIHRQAHTQTHLYVYTPNILQLYTELLTHAVGMETL